jgi:hypothetical protein
VKNKAADRITAHLEAKGTKALTKTQMDALQDFHLGDPPSVISEVENLRNEVKQYRQQLLDAEAERDAALAERDAALGERGD